MSAPDLSRPECWTRAFPSGQYTYMSCHWSDVRSGHVVPKKPGQIFQFVDLDELWMYLGEPEPDSAPVPKRERAMLLVGAGICLSLIGVELYLIWLMWNMMREAGMI